MALTVLLLLVALGSASCVAPWGAPTTVLPTPTATESPLARTLIYWSQDQYLLAIRASDGKERWRVGNWMWPFPDGTGDLVFGPAYPVMENGALFATSNANHTGVPTAYALNPVDGSIRWQTPLAGCIAHPGGPPLAVDGTLYVALTGQSSNNLTCGSSGWVFAVRESDGSVLWRMPFQHVVFTSLVLTDGVLIVANSSYPAEPETVYLTGLRASGGTRLWQIQRPWIGLNEVSGADGVVAVSGVDQASNVGNPSGLTVEAFSAMDGRRLWHVELDVRLTGDILFQGQGFVYVHSDLGYLYALRVTDGSVAWQFPTGVRFIGSPTAVGGRLYVGIGPQLDVLNAATGALLRMYPVFTATEDTGAGSAFVYGWSRPLFTGGGIFVTAARVCACIPSHPVGALYAVDEATGRALWQHPSPLGGGGWYPSDLVASA